MNLRKKIAQMLIMGFPGTTIDHNNPVSKWLSEEQIGGVLLFDYDCSSKQYGKNIQSREQIKKLNQKIASYSQIDHDEHKLPPFIALDYEGGTVDRLKHVEGCIKTITPHEQGLLSDNHLFNEAQKMAISLKELGFNLNFAPVVDLNLNGNQGIIGKLERSFSADPKQVARAARLFVKAFSQYGIITAYKHFPGHGSAVGDSHEGFVDVSHSFQSSELEPYEQLLPQEWPTMIMTAHVINNKLDPTGIPATLSQPILTELLRNKLAFKGVIVSDDLQMRAISNHYSLADSLRLTINAGADMLIFANQLDTIDASEVIDCIEHLIRSGEVEVKRIDEAYQRIRRLKESIAVLVPSSDTISFES